MLEQPFSHCNIKGRFIKTKNEMYTMSILTLLNVMSGVQKLVFATYEKILDLKTATFYLADVSFWISQPCGYKAISYP